MHLQLISTKRCPFVQRSIITLNYKGIEHEMTFVDLDDPPGWFKEISPFGKVPLLRVDNDTVIFESAVINEFLDEVTPGQLHPADPLQRALNRSWIEFGGNCCGLTFQLMVAPEQQAYEAIVGELSDNLQRVEKILSDGPFFNGANFSLIDAAYAPVFIRLDIFRDLFGLRLTDSMPRMSNWQAHLLKMPAVQKASVPELPDLFRELIVSRDAYLKSLL
jgi:glutathione S-transferase